MVYKHKHCKGIIAQSKLTMEDIQLMHADSYDLPDKTSYRASAHSLTKIKSLVKEVTIDDSKQ